MEMNGKCVGDPERRVGHLVHVSVLCYARHVGRLARTSSQRAESTNERHKGDMLTQHAILLVLLAANIWLSVQ
ncbi:hypothetical protein PAXRUDRAFT_831759 [Paxillus rubicundulus Ve08.2h10]|uniref:Uncharacterized protein n=1 Tax=Paxillus rubicundulus Ve08.2h10 TaxID=930991 RepID=A0A0D0E0P1_9AGAM|nr:hypothetical protein PAXRUDRAFT_831759 [Paxillus rubicundulus Ve08.2h10]